MAPLVASIDISRSPEDVFTYTADPSRFPEWQADVVSAHRIDDGPLAVGSKALVTRRVGPRRTQATDEVAELNPPKSWRYRGVSGPVVAIAEGKVEPLDGGQRSRVTIALDFEAHGIGKLLVPLVIRRQARRALPRNAQQLKTVLEQHG